MSKILLAKNIVISSACRDFRGTDAAFDYAMEELRKQYYQSLSEWDEEINIHLKMEIEYNLNKE